MTAAKILFENLKKCHGVITSYLSDSIIAVSNLGVYMYDDFQQLMSWIINTFYCHHLQKPMNWVFDTFYSHKEKLPQRDYICECLFGTGEC